MPGRRKHRDVEFDLEQRLGRCDSRATPTGLDSSPLEAGEPSELAGENSQCALEKTAFFPLRRDELGFAPAAFNN